MFHRYLAVATIVFGLDAVATVAPAIAQSSPAPSPAASLTPGSVKPAQSSPAPAATASAAPATPAPPPKTIQLSGYAAAAYAHYAGTTTPADRVFDTHTDDFNLQAVDIKALVNLPAGFGITAESSFGTDADGLASNGTSRGDGFDLPQAYVSYTKGSFSLIAGRFASLAGAEVFEDPSDYEFSRSYLYGLAEPFTHTGVRATYGFDGGKYTINAGANNGWDDIKFIGKKKTFEFGPSIVISPAFTFAATTYNGQDFTNNYPGGAIRNDGDVGNRTLYDFVLTSKVAPTVTLVSNYDNGNQQNVSLHDSSGAPIVRFVPPVGEGTGFPVSVLGSAHWTGFSQILNFQPTAKYGLSLRGEVFHDGGGFHTGYDQFLREGTATLAYAPSAPLLFRVEYRVDGSDYPTFPQNNGGLINHQNSIEVESAVKF